VLLAIEMQRKLKIRRLKKLKAERRIGVSDLLLFILGSRWFVWLYSGPASFSHERNPLPVVKLTGLTPGNVWTIAEFVAITGIRSMDQ